MPSQSDLLLIAEFFVRSHKLTCQCPVAAKGLTWDEESLNKYVADPKNFLRDYLDDKKARSKMSFKLKKDGDRENVIAFLKGK